MKLSPTYKMPFKRRRLEKTDYQKRLKLLSSGKSRLVVRKSLNYITAQIVGFDKKGDKSLAGITSKELKKIGWKFACDNLPAAYLTGLLIGKKAMKKKINEVILDAGLYPSTKGNRIYAAAKGAIDAGLKLPIGEEILPSEDRIKGKHISNDVEKGFEKIKQKILSD
jgi:large subunit ribosomal protein L18